MSVRISRKSQQQPRPLGGVEDLLKQLVDEAIQAKTPGVHNGQEAVLLDAEVQGVRCVITRPAEGPPRKPIHLSPREREITRMVARGYPNKIIADVLEISLWTVGTHLRRIFAKFGVTSRAAMVACAFSDRVLDESSVSPQTAPAHDKSQRPR